ncbi:SRPBCC family protein [Chondromyces crocatus]|uniref:ATPase n=1 Tax=Chondromyces crocatus TaxID=52 RepID=A0A0K1EF14_CHOCO|nr:SRPBCC domain-containing protein [Chondromyces crocatus]AKT39465.1 ATPase [Chondromyces crocatus]
MSTDATVTAQVTHQFTASAERVFDAWLDPEKVKLWMAMPRPDGTPTELRRVALDPRVGGTFSFVDVRDGEEIEHTGEYLEIERPTRLVFTWSIPRYSPDVDRVTVEITPRSSGCEVKLSAEMAAQWAAHMTSIEKGWGHMLDAIDAVLR